MNIMKGISDIMITIKDIIAMINEYSYCIDCKRYPCPFILPNLNFCGIDTIRIAMDYLTRGEY